jgi:hypothetical protein
MGKKVSAGSENDVDGFISDVLGVKKKRRKKKYKMTVTIDHDLWEESVPYLEGKYSTLLEASIRAYLEREKNKT